jgi:hypothetical protein
MFVKIIFFVLLLSSISQACPPDSSKFAYTMCKSPQYNKCFGISKSDCEAKAEIPFAYCYKAFGLTHKLEKSLKPISGSLKSPNLKLDDSDPFYCSEVVLDLAKCAEAVFYYTNEKSLVKGGECETLMSAEVKRWSSETKSFAIKVKNNTKF